jgi:oxygen-independent coproporphyrinogen-3 oxidase
LPHDELAIAARTGALRRNFQGYTTDDANTLVGIGASAIGRLAQGFVQNAPDVAGYERAIRAGRFATVRGVALALADRVRGRVIERLMCDLKADLAMIAADCGSDEEFVAERAALAPLVAEGLVTVAGPRVAISDKGRPFVRLVASAFDAYLQQSRHRHSVAV